MSEEYETREASVGRIRDNGAAIAICLYDEELDRLGVDVTNLKSVAYTVTERGIEFSPGELLPTERLTRNENGRILNINQAPPELSKERVDKRYPNEEPSNFGDYWDRQRKYAFAFYDCKCRYCPENDPGELHVEHEQPLEEYETLYHAHSVNSLQIVCNDCALREY
jgi:hypothetical protein